MHRLSINRGVVWACALCAIVATAAALATSSQGQDPSLPGPVANGGAKEWMAFDPGVRTTAGLNISKNIQTVNTSNESNSVTIAYWRDGKRTILCQEALGSAQQTICGVSARENSPAPGGGYFQVVATKPVLVGGYRDVAVQGYAETKPNSNRYQFGGAGFDKDGVGVIQKIPYDWQPACPPAFTSGCPGSPTVPPAARR